MQNERGQKAIKEPNQMLASKYTMEDMKGEEQQEIMSPETNIPTDTVMELDHKWTPGTSQMVCSAHFEMLGEW